MRFDAWGYQVSCAKLHNASLLSWTGCADTQNALSNNYDDNSLVGKYCTRTGSLELLRWSSLCGQRRSGLRHTCIYQEEVFQDRTLCGCATKAHRPHVSFNSKQR